MYCTSSNKHSRSTFKLKLKQKYIYITYYCVDEKQKQNKTKQEEKKTEENFLTLQSIIKRNTYEKMIYLKNKKKNENILLSLRNFVCIYRM